MNPSTHSQDTIPFPGPGYTLRPPRQIHGIFLSYNKNVLIPSAEAIRVIGNPDYIQLYVSREKKRIAIVPCEKSADKAQRVVKNASPNNRKIVLPALCRELAELSGVELERLKVTRVEGFYHDNLVEFEL